MTAKSERNKAWRKKNPDKYREHCRRDNLKADYGISIETYEVMLTNQQGLCAICLGKNAGGKRLAVDHNHDTGKIRALLCGRCNLALGLMCDSPLQLRLAANYLEAHGTAS